MVIVVKDTEEPKRRREPGRGGHGAMIVAIMALAIAGGAWFWLTRLPPQPHAGYGAPHGVIVAGIGTFIAALIVQIRSMSALEMLEALKVPCRTRPCMYWRTSARRTSLNWRAPRTGFRCRAQSAFCRSSVSGRNGRLRPPCRPIAAALK